MQNILYASAASFINFCLDNRGDGVRPRERIPIDYEEDCKMKDCPVCAIPMDEVNKSGVLIDV
jgi:hypothetical protein